MRGKKTTVNPQTFPPPSEETSRGRKGREFLMAEDLQGLLNKIQTDGILKAEEEKDKIVSKAKQDAADIVANARTEAEAILKKAEAEAVSSREKSEAAIRQAARDILIALKSDILNRLSAVAKNCAGNAMTPEVMAGIILEIAKARQTRQAEGETELEVIVAKKDAENLEKLLKGSLLADLHARPKISVGHDFQAGLQIGFSGEDVFLDFSDDTLSEIICEFVGPKLAAVLKG